MTIVITEDIDTVALDMRCKADVILEKTDDIVTVRKNRHGMNGAEYLIDQLGALVSDLINEQ